MRTRFTILVLAAACGAAPIRQEPLGPEPPRAADAPAPQSSSVDARAEVVAVLHDQVSALGAADAATIARPWAPDVFLYPALAPSPVIGRDAALAALRELLGRVAGAGRPSGVVPGGATIGLTADGAAAWAAESIDVSAGGTHTPIVVSTLLARSGAGWTIVAQSWVLTTPDDVALAAAAGGSWPPRTEVPDLTAPGAEALAERLRAWSQRNEWPRPGGGPDSIVFGTAGERFQGDEAIGARFTGALEAGVRIESLGPVATRMIATGTIGWGAFAATLILPDGKRLPVRFFAVLGRTGDDWRLLLMHASLPIHAPAP